MILQDHWITSENTNYKLCLHNFPNLEWTWNDFANCVVQKICSQVTHYWSKSLMWILRLAMVRLPGNHLVDEGFRERPPDKIKNVLECKGWRRRSSNTCTRLCRFGCLLVVVQTYPLTSPPTRFLFTPSPKKRFSCQIFNAFFYFHEQMYCTGSGCCSSHYLHFYSQRFDSYTATPIQNVHCPPSSLHYDIPYLIQIILSK